MIMSQVWARVNVHAPGLPTADLPGSYNAAHMAMAGRFGVVNLKTSCAESAFLNFRHSRHFKL